MLPRSGIYYATQQLSHARRVSLPPFKTVAPEVSPAGYREELGVFVRLWLVILAGVAVILLGSWLATHVEMDLGQKGTSLSRSKQIIEGSADVQSKFDSQRPDEASTKLAQRGA